MVSSPQTLLGYLRSASIISGRESESLQFPIIQASSVRDVSKISNTPHSTPHRAAEVVIPNLGPPATPFTRTAFIYILPSRTSIMVPSCFAVCDRLSSNHGCYFISASQSDNPQISLPRGPLCFPSPSSPSRICHTSSNRSEPIPCQIFPFLESTCVLPRWF